ncbi:MAG TPA: NosD domain-containing protein [Pyrinomonadaceae bacterium]|nr:NosD domain-containing protein [Pyrinomonadaceae bacterium]
MKNFCLLVFLVALSVLATEPIAASEFQRNSLKILGLVRQSTRRCGAPRLLSGPSISGGVVSGQTGPRASVPEKPFQMSGRLVETGTHFEVKDSKFLNITLDSSRPVNLTLESVPEMIVMRIEAAADASSTAMTISGLNPSITYHKYEDTHRNHVAFTSDAKGRYTWMQDLSHPHLVFIKPRTSTWFIGGQSDCLNPPVTSSTSPGFWSGSTCRLTAPVTGTIEVTASNITLDGNGQTITPTTSCNGIGVHLPAVSGVIVKNLIVKNFAIGILLFTSNGNRLEQNVVTSSCGDGIVLDTSHSNTLIGNRAVDDVYGIYLQYSTANSLTYNFLSSNSMVGVYMKSGGKNRLSNNFVGLGGYGIVVDDHSSLNHITCNTVRWSSNIGIGFYLASNTNTVSGNNFDTNAVQASASGISNVFTGNYWRIPPLTYAASYSFSGGMDNNPLINPASCMNFKHCPPTEGPPPDGYGADLSTGTTQPFVADPTNPTTTDPHWKVTSIPTGAPLSLLGPAQSIPPSWVAQPFVPVGSVPVQGVANWIAPPGTSYNALPLGPYTYTTQNIPSFQGAGTLIINGVASDDLVDLYLDNGVTPVFGGGLLLSLLPLTPLSMQVTTTVPHVLIAKVQNSVNNSPSGLLLIAEFCPGKVGKAGICIKKFNDLNGNGKQDTGEPGLQGWQFLVTDPTSGISVTTVTTNAQGTICFALPAPATYTVSEVVLLGWTQTAPQPVPPGTYTVTVAPGQTVNLSFGNKK